MNFEKSFLSYKCRMVMDKKDLEILSLFWNVRNGLGSQLANCTKKRIVIWRIYRLGNSVNSQPQQAARLRYPPLSSIYSWEKVNIILIVLKFFFEKIGKWLIELIMIGRQMSIDHFHPSTLLTLCCPDDQIAVCWCWEFTEFPTR